MNLHFTAMRTLKLLLLLFCFVLSSVSCAAVLSALPTVIQAVTEAVVILDQIESFADTVFGQYPSRELESKVYKALARARAALIVAQKATEGSEELSQQDVDAAFADFRDAYKELLVLMEPLGLRQGYPPPGEPTLSLAADANRLYVPEPAALSLKVPVQ